MRPVRISMNAAGYSQWIPIDYLESWFGVTLALIPSEDANLTYTVQYTCDSGIIEANTAAPISIARAGTVATVTDHGPNNLGHGLTTGDSVLIKASGSTTLDSPMAALGQGDLGWTVASTPSASTYTYTVANAGATSDQGVTKTARFRVFSHGTLSGQTSRQTGTLNYPARSVRLYLSAYAAGFIDMIVLQGRST